MLILFIHFFFKQQSYQKYYLDQNQTQNPGPAEPRYALPLQTV